MFYDGAEQKVLFEQALERAKQVWGDSIVTQLLPLETFWMGETYHQDFFAKNPTQGYCLAVAVPKVNKVRAGFAQYLTV
jgi:peptide-methionine (S)-S-oxide reductase